MSVTTNLVAKDDQFISIVEAAIGQRERAQQIAREVVSLRVEERLLGRLRGVAQ